MTDEIETRAPQTQVVLEALRARAMRRGDEFHESGGEVKVGCFNPDDHRNRDADPSASYVLGKYLVCRVCDLKLGERRLAEKLGIGSIKSGLTLEQLALEKALPEAHLAAYGWKTSRTRWS